MTRLCVLGNSHISAFVLGWRAIEDEFPDVHLDFFGGPGRTMDLLMVEDGVLRPRTEELQRYFDLTAPGTSSIAGDYDGYLVCGLRLGLLHLQSLFGNYRFEALSPDERTLVSNDCFVRALHGCVANAPAFRIVGKVRAVSSAPIVVVPDPLPASGYTECKFINDAETKGEENPIADMFTTVCRTVCAELGCACFFQPDATRSAALRTKDAYSTGSVQLRSGFAVAHKRLKGMAKHTNGEFGAVMLREIFSSPPVSAFIPPRTNRAAGRSIMTLLKPRAARPNPVLPIPNGVRGSVFGQMFRSIGILAGRCMFRNDRRRPSA